MPGHNSRLGQVISNLLSNAQSFSNAGGKVRIVCRRVRSEIEIVVDDDGPGIREDALERIFERFYTDRPHQGFGQNSGLGLSISKQIIEAHGGRIWAENRAGPVGRRWRADGGRRALRGQAAGAMTDAAGASVHASAVLVGNRAVLIRGPSGSGKSRLAFDLILAGRAGQIPPAMLVGDDRVHLGHRRRTIVVRPAAELAGLIEIRGLGIRRCDVCRARPSSAWWSIWRPPTPSGCRRRKRSRSAFTVFRYREFPSERAIQPLPLVVAALTTTESSSSVNHSADCLKGIGNHISPTIATE